MNKYGKEEIKDVYHKELYDTYKSMYEEEKRKYDAINKERASAMKDMLLAIAAYDLATQGGEGRDLNTLSVDIFTKTEKFKRYDTDAFLMNQLGKIEMNMIVLERLMKYVERN